MSNEERKKKLAEWAGFHDDGWAWLYPIPDELGRQHHGKLPDFSNSLDACFKWLPDIFHSIEFVYFPDRVQAVIWHQLEQYSGEAPKKQEALALCNAIEKLIEAEGSK